MHSHRPMRLSKDISELEDDFVYNLSLLKFQEAELFRYRTWHTKLEDTLRLKLLDIDQLTSQVSRLEGSLRECKKLREDEKLIYSQTLNNLQAAVIDMRNIHSEFRRQMEKRTASLKTELEEAYADLFRINDNEHRRAMAIINGRLQQELCKFQKAKDHLRRVSEENVSLRNQLAEHQSRFIAEKSIFESELKTMHTHNQVLISELETNKRERASIGTEIIELRAERDSTKAKLTRMESDNKKLNNVLDEMKSEIGNLREQITRIEEENRRLIEASTEAVTVSQIREDYKCENCVRLEEVSKQNAVLQMVIKSMRQERAEMLKNQEEDIRRLDNVENMIKCLVNKT